MKNYKILCACVIFPNMKKYASPFFKSIDSQTKQSFDFLIVNDGWAEFNEKQYLARPSIIRYNKENLCPVQIREMIINYAVVNNYEALIFSDSDDICDAKRIEVLSEFLLNNDLVVHNMAIIDELGNISKDHFINNKSSEKVIFSKLIYKNYSGLGNSGYRVEVLKKYVGVRNDILAFDWWLALQILHKPTARAIYIPQVLSFYRNHDNNYADIHEPTNDKLINEYNIKINIYCEALSKLALNQDLAYLIKEALCRTIENYYKMNINKHPEVWWDFLD